MSKNFVRVPKKQKYTQYSKWWKPVCISFDLREIFIQIVDFLIEIETNSLGIFSSIYRKDTGFTLEKTSGF